MTDLAPLMSSAEQGWRTPEWYLDIVRGLTPRNVIDFDPASAADNPTKASYLCHPGGVNGLELDWASVLDDLALDHMVTHLNSPYGSAIPGWAQACHENALRMFRTDKEFTLLSLWPARTETAWFRQALDSCDLVLFLSRRVTFVPPPGHVLKPRKDGRARTKPDTAPFPSAVFVWTTQQGRVHRAFESVTGWFHWGEHLAATAGYGSLET